MPKAKPAGSKAICVLPECPSEDEVAIDDQVEDASRLSQDVGFVLRLAQIAVFRSLTEALRPFDFRVIQYVLVKAIRANAGLTQQHLGRIMRVKKANLVSLVDELEQRGLIVRERAEADRRSYALYLSQAGEKLFLQMGKAHAKHTKQVRDALGGDLEQQHLLRRLEKLSRV